MLSGLVPFRTRITGPPEILRGLSFVPVQSATAQQALEALALRLREIRKDAGLTARAVARAAGWHESKCSRIEHARTVPSPDDIRTWCRDLRRPGPGRRSGREPAHGRVHVCRVEADGPVRDAPSPGGPGFAV